MHTTVHILSMQLCSHGQMCTYSSTRSVGLNAPYWDSSSFRGLQAPEHLWGSSNPFPVVLDSCKPDILTQQVWFTYSMSHLRQPTMTFEGLLPPKPPSLMGKSWTWPFFIYSVAHNSHECRKCRCAQLESAQPNDHYMLNRWTVRGRVMAPTELWSTFLYYGPLMEPDRNQCPEQPGITDCMYKTWNNVWTTIMNLCTVVHLGITPSIMHQYWKDWLFPKG